MSSQSQADKILARLQRGPATSWELGPDLGILSLTRRIFELRKRYEITSTEQRQNGKRVVMYRLEFSQVEVCGLCGNFLNEKECCISCEAKPCAERL